MLTSKLLPAAGPESKLIPLQGQVGFKSSMKSTQSVTKDARRIQMSGCGNVQVKVKSSPIDDFVRWFNTFSMDLSIEKKEVLFACCKAATSLIENEWYDDEGNQV